MKKTMIFTLLAVLVSAPLAACSNTVHGAGEDIERAGENVQHAVPPKS